jgi:hypothetical protein
MDTVRPRTIIRKRTDTLTRRTPGPTKVRHPVRSKAGLRSEQIPRDGVDHSNEKADQQPLRQTDAAQAVGQRAWQAEGRSASSLNSPQDAKQAQDQQPGQGEWVVAESRRNVTVEQCPTHPGATTERAVPARQSAERTGQRQPGGCVEGTQSKPPSKEGTDVSSCTSCPELPGIRRDRHLFIVPGRRALSMHSIIHQGCEPSIAYTRDVQAHT